MFQRRRRDAESSSGSDAAPRACVILPDAASSPRWEGQDHPYLEEGLTDAGYEVDIQNAQGDKAKYVTIGEQQMTQGCDIMILADFEGAALGVAEKAQAEGIPVIAYDRPIEGADYYVSFDNFGVGELQGQCVVDGLAAAGKDPATAIVIYMGGAATDGNAKMFHDGAVSIMEAAGIMPAQEPPGIWDQKASATNFENALTATGGKVDAVWAANDPNAAGVISILDANNLVVPVSGTGRHGCGAAERASRQAGLHDLEGRQHRRRRGDRAGHPAPERRDARRSMKSSRTARPTSP